MTKPKNMKEIRRSDIDAMQKEKHMLKGKLAKNGCRIRELETRLVEVKAELSMKTLDLKDEIIAKQDFFQFLNEDLNLSDYSFRIRSFDDAKKRLAKLKAYQEQESLQLEKAKHAT